MDSGGILETEMLVESVCQFECLVLDRNCTATIIIVTTGVIGSIIVIDTASLAIDSSGELVMELC